MDTSQLKAFLKIAELGSISRAAVSLGLAQPSLSQQLLRLEDEVGCPLFNRTARGVVITEVGRVFRERARQILHTTEQAIQDARHLKAEASGQVIFAMPPSISKLIGTLLVEALLDHAPQVKVRIVESFTGNIRGWLDAAKIDLGILFDQGPLRPLTTRKLVREELFLIGPAAEFGSAAAPTQVPLEALSKFPLITAGPQHGLRQLLEREANRQAFELNIDQEIDAVDIVVGLVTKGFGYAILPLPTVAAELAAGTLSVARLGGGAIERSLSLARNPSSVLTHASIRVEDLTLKIMSRPVAGRLSLNRRKLRNSGGYVTQGVLTDKVALVTGAGRGMGREIALRLAKDGAAVVVHYSSSKAGADGTVAAIKASGGNAIAYQADIAKRAEVIALFEQIDLEPGRIDIIVNNSGVSAGGKLADLDEEQVELLLNVNLRGPLYIASEAAKRLGEGGRIINVGSTLAEYPVAGSGVYSAAKSAIKSFTESWAKELGAQGVTVNTVIPGATSPGMAERTPEPYRTIFQNASPFKRIGRAEEIAAVIAFLASPESSWVSGAHILANGAANA